MRQVYDTEVEMIAEIERLELDAREACQRLQRAGGEQDKRVLNRQLDELERRIECLRWELKQSYRCPPQRPLGEIQERM